MGRQEQRIKELVLSRVATCGQCGGGYELSDANVLGHKDDLWFLMLICGQCHQAVGVAAVVKEQSVAAAGEAGEAGRREGAVSAHETTERQGQARSGPVTAGDVAEMSDFLRDFDGDFRRLFGG